MPKFIGNTIPGSVEIHDDARATDDRIRISYSQAALLPPGDVMHSLDTSDRGGRNQKAKRWYRWFTTPDAITKCPRSTANMKSKIRPSLVQNTERVQAAADAADAVIRAAAKAGGMHCIRDRDGDYCISPRVYDESGVEVLQCYPDPCEFLPYAEALAQAEAAAREARERVQAVYSDE